MSSADDDENVEIRIPVKERTIFYAGVGQAISFWASMEGVLVEIAAKLLGTSERKTGLILYSIMNFYSWLNIIDELFSQEEKYSEQKIEWGSACAKLRSLNDIRVRLAHHTVWDGSPNQGTSALRPNQYDARAKSQKYAPLVSDEILAFIDNVTKTEDTLIEVRKAMAAIDKLPPQPLRGTLFQPTADQPPIEGAQ